MAGNYREYDYEKYSIEEILRFVRSLNLTGRLVKEVDGDLSYEIDEHDVSIGLPSLAQSDKIIPLINYGSHGRYHLSMLALLIVEGGDKQEFYNAFRPMQKASMSVFKRFKKFSGSDQGHAIHPGTYKFIESVQDMHFETEVWDEFFQGYKTKVFSYDPTHVTPMELMDQLNLAGRKVRSVNLSAYRVIETIDQVLTVEVALSGDSFYPRVIWRTQDQKYSEYLHEAIGDRVNHKQLLVEHEAAYAEMAERYERVKEIYAVNNPTGKVDEILNEVDVVKFMERGGKKGWLSKLLG